MDVRVHSKNLRVTPSIQRFAADKLSHLTRFLAAISSIDVELHEEGNHRPKKAIAAHVTVVAGRRVFRSKVIGKDPHTCLDVAATRLERNIKEYKRRHQGKPPHSRTKAPRPDTNDIGGAADDDAEL